MNNARQTIRGFLRTKERFSTITGRNDFWFHAAARGATLFGAFADVSAVAKVGDNGGWGDDRFIQFQHHSVTMAKFLISQSIDNWIQS